MKTSILLCGVLCASAACGIAAGQENKLVVHEWGTFTSVQGSDGKLLAWQPFTSLDLPAFVYDWRRPGLGRDLPLAYQFNKGGIRSLQRMETPVIYFYADRELAADVTVRFPNGLITEWYPQAQEIECKKSSLLTGLMPGRQSLESALKDSTISWRNVRVIPEQRNSSQETQLATDGTANHYFAARETDSALLRIAKGGTNGNTVELEKLLFYRGAGNFATPLKVTITSDSKMTVENTGGAPISHLFLVQIRNGHGEWKHMNGLAGRESQKWERVEELKPESGNVAEKNVAKLGVELEAALGASGLYPREASAMVKTWRNSWFAEDGLRVLYILPREWTDQTLPLTLDPQPAEIVRVMVGRAEIIPPWTQNEIAAEVPRVKSGDAGAQKRVTDIAKRLGRFYEPAWQLAEASVKREGTQ